MEGCQECGCNFANQAKECECEKCFNFDKRLKLWRRKKTLLIGHRITHSNARLLCACDNCIRERYESRKLNQIRNKEQRVLRF